jgi:uncharacterized membrane protein YkvA (DUF1232 family)
MPKITREQTEAEFQKYSKDVSKDDVSDVLNKEQDIMKKSTGPLSKFIEDIQLLFSLIKDHTKGNYKDISWATIAAVVGTLIYIFSPIDLIPDFIPILGLTDDAALVAFCLNSLHNDLQKYKEWKNGQTCLPTN